MQPTIRAAATATLLALTAMSPADDPTGALVVSSMNDNTGRFAVVSNYGVRGKPGHTFTVIDIERLAVARTIELGTGALAAGSREALTSGLRRGLPRDSCVVFRVVPCGAAPGVTGPRHYTSDQASEQAQYAEQVEDA